MCTSQLFHFIYFLFVDILYSIDLSFNSGERASKELIEPDDSDGGEIVAGRRPGGSVEADRRPSGSIDADRRRNSVSVDANQPRRSNSNKDDQQRRINSIDGDRRRHNNGPIDNVRRKGICVCLFVRERKKEGERSRERAVTSERWIQRERNCQPSRGARSPSLLSRSARPLFNLT